MEALEQDIIQWLLQAYPQEAEALSTQLESCVIKEREFTNGGGVFVSLKLGLASKPVSDKFLAGFSRANGPDISSSELELGATVDVVFEQSGFIDHFEIASLANDYPKNRHPNSYELSKP